MRSKDGERERERMIHARTIHFSPEKQIVRVDRSVQLNFIENGKLFVAPRGVIGSSPSYAGYTQGGKSTRIAVLSKRRGEKFFTAAKQGGIDGLENISVPLFAVTHPVYVPGITHVYIGHRYVDQHAAVHNVI